jgi:hypothetical protein
MDNLIVPSICCTRVHLQKEKIRELHLQAKLHTKGMFYIEMKQTRDFSILKHNGCGQCCSGGAEFC